MKLLISILFTLVQLIFSQRNQGMKLKYLIKSIIKRKSDSIVYTQGLIIDSHETYIESGGLFGHSTLTRRKLNDQQKLNSIKLPDNIFGEGIAICKGFLYQLTWTNKIIRKYSVNDFKLIQEYKMDQNMKSGWGLTSDGNILYATDGSSYLFHLDCENLEMIKKFKIKDNYGNEIDNLNEIEYTDGFIFANVYMKDIIVKFTINGKYLGYYDMSDVSRYEISHGTLSEQRKQYGDVLNGIAYNKFKKSHIITGKKWGHYYEIMFE